MFDLAHIAAKADRPLFGALCVAIGISYLVFGLLRWTQTLDTFTGASTNFWPYFIAFGALLVCTAVAAWAMSRKFSDGDEA